MKRTSFVFVTLVAILALTSSFSAQIGRNLERDKSGGRRIALVIGNAAYSKAKPLTNPANDAADMAVALKGLGFEVFSGVNLDKRRMEILIRDFGTKLTNGGTGLFYYAGHGIQVGGENYLIPVDADIPEEDEVGYSAVPVGLVLQKMASAKNDLNIVILDACRNNPFARSWRGYRDSTNSDGLAKISPPTGTLVLYATEPGKVASDGTGRNGLFTESLLKQIKRPNLEYDQLVKALSTDVWQKSNKQQLPWKEGNSLQDFYFSGAADVSAPINSGSPTGDSVGPVKRSSAKEKEAWDLVKDSSDIKDFVAFMHEFPEGEYFKAAGFRVDNLGWAIAKSSNDKAKVKAYLDEFEDGENAAAARILLRQLEAKPEMPSAGTVRENSIGMELVWIPPGEFMMGSDTGEGNERPVRKVKIGQGFWMGKYEVTQEQWVSVMGKNPSSKVEKCGAHCPVEYVSWNDAKEFIAQLNSRSDAWEYSLPTEAQWEYAARAGTTGEYYGPLEEIGWYKKNSDARTHPVGGKKPNAFGLYDMLGNVWEWCEDVYNKDGYGGHPVDGSANFIHGDSKLRVARGGAYILDSVYSRSASRGGAAQSMDSTFIGFRLAARLK